MRVAVFAVSALITIGSPSSWAVNKCVGPGGGVSYQEAPCEVREKAEELRIQKFPSSPSRDDLYNNAIATGKVMAGMSAAQARRAWGTPDSINRSGSASSSTEQWVYGRHDFRSSYLYLENGRVRSWQTAD